MGPVAEQPVGSFAGLLRQLRDQAGLTQEELAERARAVCIGQLPGQRVLIGQGRVTSQSGQHGHCDLRHRAVPRGAFC